MSEFHYVMGFFAFVGTVIYACLQIVITGLDVALIDKAGRKPLLLVNSKQRTTLLQILDTHLHAGSKRSIFHSDIKPSNILLDSNMVPKPSDFGLSLQGPLSTSKLKPIEVDYVAGTFRYVAPECQLLQGGY
ncbi:CBL-interacting protein kinase 24-like isoform X2 [Arachis ipaensis]|uniref:CBL-interacting protein kinase 24-like isoform X2 n=1 Tax=Arachis ipaensis TaxID=130454 RepID=UPI000A2B44CA|nr:CBL-interacting protein kinase 24-like isoform X2 [Arachis ipaensis]